MLFKVKSAGLPSPATFSIKLSGGQVYFVEGKRHTTGNLAIRQVDLKVFYSNNDKIKDPSEGKNLRMVKNPKSSTLLSEQSGAELFKTPFLYFTLYSSTGC